MIDQDEHNNILWNRITLSVIGASQGILYYLFYRILESSLYIPLTVTTLWILVSAMGLLLMLLIDRDSWKMDLLFSVVIGLIVATLYMFGMHYHDFITSSSRRAYFSLFWLPFSFTCILLLVIPTPFYQAAKSEGQLHFPYQKLFLNAWNNKLSLLVAALFTGLSWLILILWTFLFKMIKINFFGNLFFDPWFIYVFTGAIFGLGISVSRERQAVTQALLKLMLTLFNFLAPVMAFIIIFFLIALPFTGVDALWETRRASPLLLSTVILFIVFQNAVIQTGENKVTLWKPVQWIIMAGNVVSPVFSIISLWGISLRISQYGWTPDRFYMALLAGVILLYTVTYAGNMIIKRHEWVSGIIRLNPPLALFVLALTVIMHLPPFEPYGLSARDQLSRLRDGTTTPAQFDYAFLKFKLGRAGRNALSEIEADEKLMKNSVINKRVTAVQAETSYYQANRAQNSFSTDELADVTSYMYVYPDNVTPPIKGIAKWIDIHRYLFKNCKKASNLDDHQCAIMVIDLNNDGLDDMAFMANNYRNGLNTLIQKPKSSWEAGPYLTQADTKTPMEEIWSAIKKGNVDLVPHETRDVMIGGTRFK